MAYKIICPHCNGTIDLVYATGKPSVTAVKIASAQPPDAPSEPEDDRTAIHKLVEEGNSPDGAR